jgi:hypothetical protein
MCHCRSHLLAEQHPARLAGLPSHGLVELGRVVAEGVEQVRQRVPDPVGLQPGHTPALRVVSEPVRCPVENLLVGSCSVPFPPLTLARHGRLPSVVAY